MSKPLTMLCVHGVSHSEIDPEFRSSWTKAITAAVHSCDPDLKPTIDFLEYDDLFDKAELNPATYAIALGKLLASSIVHGIGEIFSRSRGITDLPEIVKWTAGMVAQWSTDAELREKLRDVVLAKMESRSYDVVLAHSLGSLICYDTFVRNPKEIKDRVFVSFGSQIGNPAVRDVFAGRIEALASRKWYHLFNPDDHVMTYPVKVAADNFGAGHREIRYPQRRAQSQRHMVPRPCQRARERMARRRGRRAIAGLRNRVAPGGQDGRRPIVARF